MDKLSKQQRHKCMAAIRSKDTKPEMIVRRGLWKRGFRYRLNHKRLPGHPDLVLRKYRICIFVNGCFWHGHLVAIPPNESGEFSVESLESVESRELKSSSCCKIPKTNREFWVAKIRRKKERGREEQKQFAAMGWHSITIGECELKPVKREETLKSLAYTLNKIFLLRFSTQAQSDDLQDRTIKRYEIPAERPLMAAEEISPLRMITATTSICFIVLLPNNHQCI